MKNRIIHLILTAVVPLFGYAQLDDMYFVPRKENKNIQQQTATPRHGNVRETTDETYVPATVYRQNDANTRDVDEYNRRYRPDESVTSDSAAVVERDGDAGSGNDPRPSDGDYAYSKRILRFYTPTVGIPVSSPLYWDLCYGPNSIYWNVYDDGIYAYAFPSCWNDLYYGPYFSWSWGWHPYYHSYWGWGHPWYGGWYDPWYGSHWHHYPHWGGPHHPGGGIGGNRRPVARPSVRYRENSDLARGGSSRSTARNGLSNRTRTVRSNVGTNRNTAAPTRSNNRTTTTRSRSMNNYNRSTSQPSRSTFSNPGRSPMRSGGGFSPSRSGSVSRGRR